MKENTVKPKTLGIFLGLIVVLALFLRLQQSLTKNEVKPVQQEAIQAAPVKQEPAKVESKEVDSVQYHLSVQIPTTWTEDQNSLFDNEFTRYQGADGYISFDVAGIGSQTIDEVTSGLAGATSKPFGNEPSITSATIDGQPARFILPSPDQAPDKHNEAALIVAYRTPTVIDSKSYGFLVLYINKDSIYEIGQSLKITETTLPASKN